MAMEEKNRICPACGAENPEDNRFCEACGCELQSEAAAPAEESSNESSAKSLSKKKKLLIGVVLGVLVVAAGVVGVVKYLDSKTSAEYNAKLSEADNYLEEQEYDKAETAYLQAIDIEPKKEKAYLQVADVYVTQKRYDDAEQILQKGQDQAGGKKIRTKLKQVQPYGLYDDYLNDTIVPDIGLADLDELKNRSQLKQGLVSAEIRDFNKDEIPDMLTVAYADDKITITLYTCEDDEVTELDSVEEKLYLSDVEASKVDIFLKEYEDQIYLIQGQEFLYIDGGYRESKAFTLDGSIELQCDIAGSEDVMAYTYQLNGKTIADYEGEEEGYDEEVYRTRANKAINTLAKAMEDYGISADRLVLKEDSYLSLKRAKCNEDDPTETYISHFQSGVYISEDQIDVLNGEKFRMEDKTDVRSRIK